MCFMLYLLPDPTNIYFNVISNFNEQYLKQQRNLKYVLKTFKRRFLLNECILLIPLMLQFHIRIIAPILNIYNTVCTLQTLASCFRLQTILNSYFTLSHRSYLIHIIPFPSPFPSNMLNHTSSMVVWINDGSIFRVSVEKKQFIAKSRLLTS